MKLQNILLIGGGLALAYLLFKSQNANSDSGGAGAGVGISGQSNGHPNDNLPAAPMVIPSGGSSGVNEAAVAAVFPIYQAAAQAVTNMGGQGGEVLSHHVPGYTISGYVPASLNPNMH